MKNITTLRDHLFGQLERLEKVDTIEEMELEINKAASIIHLTDAILRTAEVEANIMSTSKTLNSSFIPSVINIAIENNTNPALEESKDDDDGKEIMFDENNYTKSLLS